MLEDKLHEAIRADEDTREHIIRELASQPDEILGALVDHLRFGPKGGTWRIAARVIHAIGYPRNKAAIPQLIDHAGDLNDPANNEASQALLDMGTEAVVPALIQVLLDRGQSIDYWGDTTNGICAMLAGKDASCDYALLCGPAVAYLLTQEELAARDEDFDFIYLLDVLKKIGQECAVYALPALINLLRKEGTSELGQEARQLIASFDAAALEPYKYVLPDDGEK